MHLYVCMQDNGMLGFMNEYSCVCMSVRTRYSGSTRSYNYNERCHRVKRQICGNNKMAFFLKWSYSKVRAGFTYLGRGGQL